MQAPLHRRHSSGGAPAPSYGTLPAPDESGNHDGDHARPRDLPEEETLSTLTLRCFVCICLGVFLGDASRGLVTPSLAPYIKEVTNSSPSCPSTLAELSLSILGG